MKTSKKIIIPFFSTVVGLSMAAGVGGAFAWYQYNSQVTASFVGTSVADNGVLQIGHLVMENNQSVMKWGRDFYGQADLAKMVPVTFGKMGANNALPDQAYAYPEAGCGAGYSKWAEATENVEYATFDIYFRSLVPSDTDPSGYEQSARNVFISDAVLESVVDDKVAEEAIRIHLAVEGGKNFLLSKNEHKGQTALNLFGELDLDNNEQPDTYHDTVFEELPTGVNDGDPMIYGVDGDKQETVAVDDMKTARVNGKMPTSGDEFTNKKILTTSATQAVKVTVTIWLEGWEYLDVDDQNTKSQVWNPEYSADTDVQVGLQFDSGEFRGDDLYQA